jgi:vacuolar-type H+-ATPase subunit C/Vma6
VRPSWEALGARARGLATHLLSDERARGLEHSTSAAELLQQLRDTPYERYLPTHEAAGDAVEAGIARSLGERMTTLARWAGRDGRALRPIFLEQDARNVRAIMRGVVGTMTPEQRLADAIPTPLLDRRALEVLARAESARAVAATLVGWAHPFGSALMEESSRTHPDLLRIETALARRLAREALSAAKGSDRRMLAFVRQGLDADNIVSAILLAGVQKEGEPLDYFLEGGTTLGRDDFVRAAAAPDRARCAELLARATWGTLFTRALREPPPSPAAVAARILTARIDDLAARSRVEPISPAPVLLFLLRLRREAWLLRRSLWRASLTGGRRA